ncbi:MAG TPA: hypothetical protein VFG43_12760 [Geminicoccaceae bacterium]|nr:hypothetical protein [Geminicoccaceae bacterium]
MRRRSGSSARASAGLWQESPADTSDHAGAAEPTSSEERRLIRFFAGHGAIGVAVGWGILGALVALDVGRLGELLYRSEQWLLTLGLAASGFAGTFGAVAIATALFLLPKD